MPVAQALLPGALDRVLDPSQPKSSGAGSGSPAGWAGAMLGPDRQDCGFQGRQGSEPEEVGILSRKGRQPVSRAGAAVGPITLGHGGGDARSCGVEPHLVRGDREAEMAKDADMGAQPNRRERLLLAAVRHLETRSAEALRVSDIAEEADVAIGLITHYFGGRDGLVTAAQQYRIVGATKQDIVGSRAALAEATDFQELLDGIREVARSTVDRQRAEVRLSRFAAIATAHGRPEAKEIIGGTLSELIADMEALIADAQAQGIIASSRSARGLATFIQAYSLGLLIHDLDLEPCDDEELLDIAMVAIRAILSAD